MNRIWKLIRLLGRCCCFGCCRHRIYRAIRFYPVDRVKVTARSRAFRIHLARRIFTLGESGCSNQSQRLPHASGASEQRSPDGNFGHIDCYLFCLGRVCNATAQRPGCQPGQLDHVRRSGASTCCSAYRFLDADSWHLQDHH